jgi:hypothetical protein
VAVVRARVAEAAADVVDAAVVVPVAAAVTAKVAVAEAVAAVLAATATLRPGLRKPVEAASLAFRKGFINRASFYYACRSYEGISHRKTVLRVLD